MANILIIDDDISVLDYLSTLVTRLGHDVARAETCAQAIEQMADDQVEVIIADIYLPDSPPLEEWLDSLKTQAKGRPLILITGEPSTELAEMVKSGEILAFLSKPFELAFIKTLLAQATSS